MEVQCYSSRVKKKESVSISMHCLFVLVRSEAALNLQRFFNACAPHHCSIVSQSVGVASGQCVSVFTCAVCAVCAVCVQCG